MNAAAISAIAQGGSGLLSSALNFWANERNMNWQEKMYNQYYSPESQMQQMIEAGINPNSAAAGVSGSGPGSMPQASNSNNPFDALGEGVVAAYQQGVMLPHLERYYDAISTKVENENLVTGDSSVIQTRKESYFADLRKRIADASVSEANATIIQAEAEYAPENAYNNALILYQKHENLVKEFDRIESEIRKNNSDASLNESLIGLNNVQKWSESVQAAREQYLLEYLKMNGYDKDDPLWVKYTELMKQGKSEEAKELLENAVHVLKETSKGEAAGNFEGSSPANEAFANVAEYRKELSTRIDDIIKLRRALDDEYKAEKISPEEYQKARKALDGEQADLKAKKDTADKDYRKGLYITGTPTFWQDLAQKAPAVIGDLIGTVLGLTVAGKVGAAKASTSKNGTYKLPTYKGKVGTYQYIPGWQPGSE